MLAAAEMEYTGSGMESGTAHGLAVQKVYNWMWSRDHQTSSESYVHGARLYSQDLPVREPAELGYTKPERSPKLTSIYRSLSPMDHQCRILTVQSPRSGMDQYQVSHYSVFQLRKIHGSGHRQTHIELVSTVDSSGPAIVGCLRKMATGNQLCTFRAPHSTYILQSLERLADAVVFHFKRRAS